MEVEIQILNKNATIPSRGSSNSAGYDLSACLENSICIAPNETVKIGTGLSIAIPDGYFGAIFARSGISTKKGLRPANCVGVCDSDYRGEYIVALHNDSNETQVVNNGDRIAQLIVMPYLNINFKVVDKLSDTDRGNSGFGSTGE